MQPRVLTREWLDDLPPADPLAVRSRADLRRLNAIMGHARIVAGRLAALCQPAPEILIDLGGGDGAFALAVARRLAPKWEAVEVIVVDLQPLVTGIVRSSFQRMGWSISAVQSDAVSFLSQSTARNRVAIMANLFLHHLENAQLERLFESAARTVQCFVACEPRRSPFALLASRLVGLVGCNSVTRHDAVVSVRAGFRDAELTALWLAKTGWKTREHKAGAFSHAFEAVSLKR